MRCGETVVGAAAPSQVTAVTLEAGGRWGPRLWSDGGSLDCGAARERLRAWATARWAAFCAIAVMWSWGRGRARWARGGGST